jgi:rubrerythrin
MKKTMENLKSAFAGESQANRKYLAITKKAEQEGNTQIVKLFKAAALLKQFTLITIYELWAE